MDLERLRQWVIPPITHSYTVKDTMLYALGLGFGADPMNEAELGYVFEDGLSAVPSLCNTLSHPGFWLQEPSLGIDWVKILHGEQSFEIHTTLPTEGKVRGDYRIVSVEDKGAGKAAVLTLEKRLTDCVSGQQYCTVTTTVFMRGDGGYGGFGTAPTPPAPMPDDRPDLTVDLTTVPQIALIYRLSGDYNPLHASPGIARAAGFERPILHGLCTMGIANRALLKAVCGYDATRVRSMFVRFSQPVFPGETIRTEIFHHGDHVRFRCRSVERNAVVLERGLANIAPAG